MSKPLVAVFIAFSLLVALVVAASAYPDAPSDAGTLILNGGDCNRRTATWTHGGDYELYVLPATAPMCFSLGGVPFEHPYSFYLTEWDGEQWVETYDNDIKYPISRCYEMPGGAGWGGQQMIIKHVNSGALYFKPVDNASPHWRCWRNWLPEVRK